jgi:surface protein
MSGSSVPAYLIPSVTETTVNTEYNIAIGYNALVNNSNVSYNMNNGEYSVLPNLTGVNNTAVGDSSLQKTKGKNNTALGYKTGISNIVGNNNTFLGNNADCDANNLNNSTAIGYKSRITKDNQIVLGNSDIQEVILGSANAKIQIGTASLTQNKINSFASETYVNSAITSLIDGAPATLDTLKEISVALNDNTNLAGTLISSIATKANSSESAHYLYQSADFNLNTISTPVTNKIYNVVNISTNPINILNGSENILTLSNKYTYDSFIYDGTTWYNVTLNSKQETNLLDQFIYSFDYTGSNLTADISNNIPIIKTLNINYTYTLSTIGTITTVIIKSTFDDNGTTHDGLSFNNTTVRNFYNGNTVTNLKIIQFGKIPLSRGGSQFSGLTKLTIEDTKSPIILINTSMLGIFYNAINFNSDISKWNTSNVTNMSDMFNNAKVFNSDISTWDTSNVVNMTRMFYGAWAFNQNIGNWNTSNVTNMFCMFFDAIAFNKTISYNVLNDYWNTRKVTDMRSMFENALVFNQNIGNWNTIGVRSNHHMNRMFNNAIAFNNGDIPGGTTQKMNWTISFTGIPPDFSVNSALTEANKPTFRSS